MRVGGSDTDSSRPGTGMPPVTPDHHCGGVFDHDTTNCNDDDNNGPGDGVKDTDDGSLNGSIVSNMEELYAQISTPVDRESSGHEDFVGDDGDETIVERCIEFDNNSEKDTTDELTAVGKGWPSEDDKGMSSGPKFKVNDTVVVIEVSGQYEAIIRDIRPASRGRSKYEYLVEYKDWSGWDKWCLETALLVQSGTSLAQVDFTKRTSKITPFSREKEGAACRAQRSRVAAQEVEEEEDRASRRGGKRKRPTGSSNHQAKAARRRPTRKVASAPTHQAVHLAHATAQGSALHKSTGRTRAELNQHDVRLLKEKTGIFAKFGMSTIATKDNKVSHLVMNDEWNVLAPSRCDAQELYLGTGSARARGGNLLAAVAADGIPLFHAPKKAEKTTKIYYVGHWAPIREKTKYFQTPKIVKGQPRQMLVRLRFVRYDDKIDQIMTVGTLMNEPIIGHV